MNDPTLSRPMFQQRPSAASSAMPSMGIGGMTTPDQNAMALRNLFSPQAFRGGGEVINGVKHFLGGGLNKSGPGDVPVFQPGGVDASDPLSIPQATGEPEAPTPEKYVPKTPIGRSLYGAVEATPERQAAFDKIQKEKAAAAAVAAAKSENPVPTIFEEVTDEQRNAAKATQQAAVNDALKKAGIETLRDSVTPGSSDATIKAMENSYSNANPNNLPTPSMGGQPPAAPSALAASTAAAPPPPNKKDEPISTNLETIRARREASDKQREDNKWMGILAAGLGMMASKSKTAAGGIGEGGLQGLQTFAGLEKSRREDEANLRREDYQQQQLGLQKQQFGLAQEQLAQQKQISMAQLEKDPDTVRLFRALGGGDLQRGLNMYQADGKLQAAKAIMDNYMATPEAKKDAEAYIQNALRRSGAAANPASGPATAFDPSKFKVETIAKP